MYSVLSAFSRHWRGKKSFLKQQFTGLIQVVVDHHAGFIVYFVVLSCAILYWFVSYYIMLHVLTPHHQNSAGSHSVWGCCGSSRWLPASHTAPSGGPAPAPPCSSDRRNIIFILFFIENKNKLIWTQTRCNISTSTNQSINQSVYQWRCGKRVTARSCVKNGVCHKACCQGIGGWGGPLYENWWWWTCWANTYKQEKLNVGSHVMSQHTSQNHVHLTTSHRLSNESTHMKPVSSNPPIYLPSNLQN